MKQLVTSIEPGRLGAVMSKLQEARVGQVKLRQGSPAGPARAANPRAARLILEVAVPEDRLHPAMEALADGGSAVLLQR